MTSHTGRGIPVTSDKADLYRGQKPLYAEPVLTVAATKMMEGNTMSELKPSVHDETNGLDYILAGDYYIPAIKLLRTMTAPSKNGGGCTGLTWKKQIRFCSTT